MTFPVRANAPRRAAIAAGAVLLLAAGAAGCGGGDEQSSGGSAAAAVAQAAKKTQAFASVHYRLSGRTPEQGRIETEASVGTKPAMARLTTSTIGGEHPSVFELRLVGGVLYERQSENGVPQRVHGRHWAGFGAADRFTAAA
jgi:DMSO/TMAO reductase YedYZ molybdopterin-dependent catalytic subunit